MSSRSAMRRRMFLAQDGVTLCMTLRALDEVGALEPSLEREQPLSELMPALTVPGFGALRVAIHGLVATGWASDLPTLDPATTTLRWTEAGRRAMEQRSRYVEIGDFLAGFENGGKEDWTQPWEPAAEERFAELVAAAAAQRGGAGDEPELVESHLDGALIVPSMLWLYETRRLGGERPALPESPLGAALRELFAGLGWLDPDGGWSESGLQARAFALHFGGVATYLPLLASLPRLYRGELTVVPDPTSGKPEWHVNRALNVRISAAAHKRYFADSDHLFLEIFDREPVAEQPRFVADMGCGQGSWLVHLHELIAEKTLRGRHLDQHPLTMIGVDPDPTALEEAQANLERHVVPALLLRGDVTDPDAFAADLAARGLAIEDGLHIRSFIDHERSYRGGEQGVEVPGWSTGAYMDVAGTPLPGEAVERDLVAHLRRWARHVGRHGMVVLEAHCNDPEIVARHLGSMHGLAFDAHQAYSKQYPVEHSAFLECCRLAGLRPVGHDELRYPAMRPFVAISLNRLLVAEEPRPLPALDTGAPRADTWRPPADVDPEDGEALHEIVFWRGDVRYPASWCAGPTGFVVRAALEAIEARLAGAEDGSAVRVLDYGAGTGTATIELLKACRERRLDRLAEQRGVEIEVHLVDLPSSWYAQGHRLLGDCAWTRFHSLRGEDGFRPLSDVLEGRTVDVAMANMVFHLIPGRALERTMAGLAGVLRPGGTLAWSAPDLGPAGPEAVLLHDPNRLLRERWLELLGGGATSSPVAAEAARQARAELDEDALRAAQDRADRRIRPRPLATEVDAALAPHFSGETRVATYEMLSGDIVRGLLVPSNQAEFLPEIADRGQREEVIRELMLGDVIPALRQGQAATGLGLSFHWTLGAHRRRQGDAQDR